MLDLFAGTGAMVNALLKDVSERSAEVACALCVAQKPLRRSHIIPNAVFRRIKQAQNSGQLIQMDDSENAPVRRSQDTWSERMLCADCERIIGGYESYGLELLRVRNGSSVEDHAGGVTFRAHDYRRFKLFLTSILWRAAVSSQEVFAKVILPERCKEEARASLLAAKPLSPLRLGCHMHRLVDTEATPEYGFDLDSLSQIVISPIPRLHDGRKYYTFLFLIEGFLLEYFVRAVPFKQCGKRGIHRDSPALFVPNKCIFDVPEIIDILVANTGKHQRGLVAFKDRN